MDVYDVAAMRHNGTDQGERDRYAVRFGRLLQRGRKRAHLNQLEFAKRLGISKSALSAYENGKRQMPPVYFARVSELTGILPSSLVTPPVDAAPDWAQYFEPSTLRRADPRSPRQTDEGSPGR